MTDNPLTHLSAAQWRSWCVQWHSLGEGIDSHPAAQVRVRDFSGALNVAPTRWEALDAELAEREAMMLDGGADGD